VDVQAEDDSQYSNSAIAIDSDEPVDVVDAAVE